MSKFIKSSLASNEPQDQLDVQTHPKIFNQNQRDQHIRLDEKKINFMTLSEQMMEQERIENSSKDEVTKVERKNIAKPTIFDKTNPLPEEQCFKQEIFNEEDFDYFQYYGQLKEMEDRNIRREKQEIQHFKQQRSKLVIEDNLQPQIVLVKDNGKEPPIQKANVIFKFKHQYDNQINNFILLCKKLHCVKIKVKKRGDTSPTKDQNEIFQKKIQITKNTGVPVKPIERLMTKNLLFGDDEDSTEEKQ